MNERHQHNSYTYQKNTIIIRKVPWKEMTESLVGKAVTHKCLISGTPNLCTRHHQHGWAQSMLTIRLRHTVIAQHYMYTYIILCCSEQFSEQKQGNGMQTHLSLRMYSFHSFIIIFSPSLTSVNSSSSCRNSTRRRKSYNHNTVQRWIVQCGCRPGRNNFQTGWPREDGQELTASVDCRSPLKLQTWSASKAVRWTKC